MERGEPPLYPEVGVLVLVDDQWNRLWQPRHHMASRLARYFRVMWVEPPVGWRDWIRGRGRTAEETGMSSGFRVLCAGCSFPMVYRPAWLSRLMLRWRWRDGARRLHRMGCKRLVVYVWRPHFRDALHDVRHDLSCYHIDDEYSWSDVDLPLPAREQALIAEADRVFIHSPELMQKKGSINPRTTRVPNGVDFNAYSARSEEPDDMRGIPHPRIGYTGFVKRQLDFDLLTELIQRNPAWSFVFVGVHRSNEIGHYVEMLRQLPNVHFLGAKPVHELARYPQHFDVCIMPYRVTDYTKYIYPMKLHEYLASGQPVVGTRIPSLIEFEDVVRLVRTSDEWQRALEASLDPSSNQPVEQERRQRIAKDHDWDTLAATVARAIATDLRLDVSGTLAGVTSPAHVGGVDS